MTIRVLVVDDSPSMRGLITATLHRDCGIRVVGQAGDPLEARQAIKALDPDVVTLDVEMPAMSGLDFLERLMRLRPTPVIMVSSLTRGGAATTLQALEIGAVDCVSKVGEAGLPPLAHLAEKVRAAAQARVRPRAVAVAPVLAPGAAGWFAPDGRVLAIGSSTGGVEALIAILSRFPTNCPPTLITQHMPPGFTRSLAERLNRLSPPEVSEAQDGAALLPGRVFLAPGGVHLELSGGATARCRLRRGAAVSGHCPSVDVLFGSVARVAGERALGVILTGMGRDGTQGLLAMREAGADTLGQDEASCVVHGMPRAAYEAGAVGAVVPLGRMAERILQLCNAKGGRPCPRPAA